MGSESSSRQVDSVGPKSQQLIDLENQFYNMANISLGRYLTPRQQGEETGYGEAPSIHLPIPSPVAPKPGRSRTPSYSDMRKEFWNSYNFSVSNSKGGVKPIAPEPGRSRILPYPDTRNPVSNGNGGGEEPKSLMDQLLDDAEHKTWNANTRIDDLMANTPWYTAQSDAALLSSRNAMDKSVNAGDKYFNLADQSYKDAGGYLKEGASHLRQAPREGDWWYNQAKDAYGRATGMLDEDRAAAEGAFSKINSINDWYDNYTRDMLTSSKDLLTTGNVPETLMNNIRANLKTSMDKTIGTSINDMATRGIVNSSVTNRGLSDMSQAAADALQRGYMDVFNSVLGGYNNSANTAVGAATGFAKNLLEGVQARNDTSKTMIGLGDSYARTGSMRVGDLLNTAAGFGNYSNQARMNADSLMGAGSNRIKDWLNIASGYGNLSQGFLSGLDMNLKEQDQLGKAIPQYFQNAYAPVGPIFELLKAMQTDHWNSNKKDTIVKQGK